MMQHRETRSTQSLRHAVKKWLNVCVMNRWRGEVATGRTQWISVLKKRNEVVFFSFDAPPFIIYIYIYLFIHADACKPFYRRLVDLIAFAPPRGGNNLLVATTHLAPMPTPVQHLLQTHDRVLIRGRADELMKQKLIECINSEIVGFQSTGMTLSSESHIFSNKLLLPPERLGAYPAAWKCVTWLDWVSFAI